MAEEMGMDNIFIFGMKENEVEDLKKRGYNAFDYYNANAELKQVRLKILFFYWERTPNVMNFFFQLGHWPDCLRIL